MVRRTVVTTNNKEIYDKLISLNFKNETFFSNFKYGAQIGRILKNINSTPGTLDVQKINNGILVKKIKPINYDVYLK